jgi:hypothetical protein
MRNSQIGRYQIGSQELRVFDEALGSSANASRSTLYMISMIMIVAPYYPIDVTEFLPVKEVGTNQSAVNFVLVGSGIVNLVCFIVYAIADWIRYQSAKASLMESWPSKFEESWAIIPSTYLNASDRATFEKSEKKAILTRRYLSIYLRSREFFTFCLPILSWAYSFGLFFGAHFE